VEKQELHEVLCLMILRLVGFSTRHVVTDIDVGVDYRVVDIEKLEDCD
jgi:hypothetical protein